MAYQRTYIYIYIYMCVFVYIYMYIVHIVQKQAGPVRRKERGERTEDRGQRTEDRGQRTEDRGERRRDTCWTHMTVLMPASCCTTCSPQPTMRALRTEGVFIIFQITLDCSVRENTHLLIIIVSIV